MKVTQKRRLLSKDSKGLYVNNDSFELLRSRAVVQEQVVQETEGNYMYTGILYVVDDKATKAFHNSKKPKKAVKKEVKDIDVNDPKTVSSTNNK